MRVPIRSLFRAGRLALLAAAVLGPLFAASRELAVDADDLGLREASATQLRSAIRSGAWTTAEGILFRASAERPAHPPLLRALGIAHYQAGRYYPAAMALKRADAIALLAPADRFLLASAYMRLERLHWARPELEQLIETQEENSEYRYSLARIYYTQQQFEDATRELHRAVRRNPDYAEAHDLLGQCLEGLGHATAAAEAYREAISSNAARAVRSPWPHYHLGSLLHDSGDLGAAEASFRDALGADPEHVPARRELGLVLQKLDRPAAAAAMLEKAARLAPRNAKIQYALSLVYGQLGNSQLAATARARFRKLAGQSR